MKLEEFTDVHKNSLKSWFEKNDSSNFFISYYFDPTEWLELVDGIQRRAYAATIEGKIVGFVDLELDSKQRASFAFGIAPALRRRGFGSRLIREAEKKAKELGAATLYAGVETRNIPCQKLLEKAGYQVTSSKDDIISYIKTLA